MSLSTAVVAQFKLILINKCAASSPWEGCALHLSTAVLGYLLILLVATAQIPTLYRILKYKHQSNLINLGSIGLLAVLSSNNVAYAVNRHLPISVWGEGVLELLAYLIIINIFFIHQGRHRRAVAFTLLYVTFMVGSLTPVVPAKFVLYLKLLNIPIDLLRKTVMMYKLCDKGDKSICPRSSPRSMALLSLCALGRLLTACVHSHDTPLRVTYGLECSTTVVLTAVMMLRDRKDRKAAKKLKESQEEEDDVDSGLSSGAEEFGAFGEERRGSNSSNSSNSSRSRSRGRRESWRRKNRSRSSSSRCRNESVSKGAGSGQDETESYRWNECKIYDNNSNDNERNYLSPDERVRKRVRTITSTKEALWRDQENGGKSRSLDDVSRLVERQER